MYPVDVSWLLHGNNGKKQGQTMKYHGDKRRNNFPATTTVVEYLYEYFVELKSTSTLALVITGHVLYV